MGVKGKTYFSTGKVRRILHENENHKRNRGANAGQREGQQMAELDKP